MLKLRQAILTVIICIACFGVGGMLAGYGLGEAAPSFVQWMMGYEFHRHTAFSHRPPDPAEFGLGFGLIGGLGFGAFLGLFLVFLLTLRDAWAVIWTRGVSSEAAPRTSPAKLPPRETGLE